MTTLSENGSRYAPNYIELSPLVVELNALRRRMVRELEEFLSTQLSEPRRGESTGNSRVFGLRIPRRIAE